MAKKKKLKKNKKITEERRERRLKFFILPEEIRKKILGIIVLILAIIFSLSFFGLAGTAGKSLVLFFDFLIGKAFFVIPPILLLGGIIFFRTKDKNVLSLVILAALALIAGIAGTLESFNLDGGRFGYFISLPFVRFFGSLVAQIIFLGVILVGLLIFWHLLSFDLTFLFNKKKVEAEVKKEKEKDVKKDSVFQTLKKVVQEPKLNLKEIKSSSPLKETISKGVEAKPIKFMGKEYKAPPLDLLLSEKGNPSAGDTVANSNIIKATLKNFGLDVEMSEINIGPTVTQYTLRPAEGIKLSKITALSNNLSLALASHSIRIEAPIPGKPLVGIEIPNKERCFVRLRELISHSPPEQAGSSLLFVLGRDVSGNPCYADLAKMPHLLVAGSTGTGKTIFLNSFIVSLLYQNSPETLRVILVDPKRVEFAAYHGLPHLLAPVIFDAQKTINALRWLVKEMERRFDILSGNGSRNITSYNEKILKNKEGESMPYIVLIIDELADLMAARGREMEAGIVRLAQMARAVGIHLVLATQRPSVEVITGLIKANVTSRVAFQVASQVDSRTILDMAGAEKLLGAGDFLFISAQIVKPKRIQGAYITEKEVKKVADYIRAENPIAFDSQELKEELAENHLAQELEKSLEDGQEQDYLYEEAKKIVIEAKKASASLLQRRLSIGYARAARLIDMLEERGIVGPGEGAKPREVYFAVDIPEGGSEVNIQTETEIKAREDNSEGGRSGEDDNRDNDYWKKI